MRLSIKSYVCIPVFAGIILAAGIASGQETGREGFPFKIVIQSDRLGYEEGNPAIIQVAVQNISEENIFFNIFTAPYTTFQPVVYTQDGTEEETAVGYRLSGRTVEEVTKAMIPRSMEIAPNETLYYKIDLNDHYRLKPGRTYKIRGFFMPDARVSKVIRSDNTLVLNITGEIKSTDPAMQIVRPQWIKPAEVVSLFLKAEQDLRWEDYVKYIDLERYINSYPDFAQPFSASSDTQKRYILKDFVTYISKPRPDRILEFSVDDQQIVNSGKSAYVTAYVRRSGPVKSIFYQYKFTLEKFRDYWRVTATEASISRDRLK